MQLALSKLLAVSNPVTNPPWPFLSVVEAVDFKKLVQHVIISGEERRDPVDEGTRDMFVHAERIAYFFHKGWDGKVIIDVGCPELPNLSDWIIDDGNHRVYAAVLRGDTLVEIGFSGDIDYGAELLKVNARELCASVYHR
jgi:hypothetical protein